MLMDLHEILQAKAYAELLTESARLDYLKKTFGARLQRKAETDPEVPSLGIEQRQGENLVDKVLDYIVSYDPSPNKQYSQWMVARYLKGDAQLENMYRAAQYLTVFGQAKGRLEKRDINAYKTFQELYAAVQPFIDGGEDVSANAVKRVEKQRMRSDDSVTVVHDGDDYLIVIPKTEEASCYWGRGTQWCTAADKDNQFDYYSRMGPLYIVINRATGEKVQFHFERQQFMDVTDSRIDLTQYLRDNKPVLDYIGREVFASVWGRVPMELWTPDDIARVEVREISKHIKTFEDLQKVPKEYLDNFEFAKRVVLDHSTDEKIARFFLSRKILDVDFFDEHMDKYFGLLKALPPRFQTDERKLLVFHGGCRNWNYMEERIPKPWPDEIEEGYWQDRIHSWAHWTAYSDVPEKFRTNADLVRLIITKLDSGDKKKEDMNARDMKFVTPEVAERMVELAPVAFLFLPDKLITAQLVTQVGNSLANRATLDHQKRLMIYDGKVNRELSTALPSYLKRAPLNMWPVNLFPYIIQYDKTLPFSKIPESKRLPKVVQAYLDNRFNGILDVPPELLTRDQVFEVTRRTELLKKLDPSLVDEAMMLERISAESYDFSLWDALPKRLQTPKIAAALYDRGWLALNSMPSVALTDDNIAKRLGVVSGTDLEGEFKSLPSHKITPLSAIKFVEANRQIMALLPDSVMSEPLLFAYLSKFGYDPYAVTTQKAEPKGQFSRFPKTMWSSRVVDKALELGLVPHKVAEVPKEYMSPEVALRIMARDAAEVGQVPADYLDEDTLAKAVAQNLDVLDNISEEKLTEPVLFAAMTYHSTTSYGGVREKLAALPRQNWSRRVYAKAVGSVITLKEVPRKWRFDDDIITTAMERDPFNLRFVPDAAEWLNANRAVIAKKDQWWKSKFEQAGFFEVGSGKSATIIDVEDLPKEPMPNGGSIVFKKVGTKNVRLFVFDKKGKLVGRMYTEGGHFTVPNARDLKPYRQIIIDAFHAHHELYAFYAGDLNALDIFSSSKYANPQPLETIPRNKFKDKLTLEWSTAITGSDAEIYVAWVNNKEIARFTYGKTGAMFGKGKLKAQDFEIADIKLATKYAAEIFGYMMAHRMEIGYDGQFLRIGILLNRTGGMELIHAIEVAKVGEFSVWRGVQDERVGIFGPKGMIAHAKLTKKGGVTNVKPMHEYRNQEPLITATFAAVETRLKGK